LLEKQFLESRNIRILHFTAVLCILKKMNPRYTRASFSFT